jgi:hypothetical protein
VGRKEGKIGLQFTNANFDTVTNCVKQAGQMSRTSYIKFTENQSTVLALR